MRNANIHFPVAIEVSRDQRWVVQRHSVVCNGRRKRPVPIPQRDTYTRISGCFYKIKRLVIVDIYKGRKLKIHVLIIEDGGLETPIAISQQHTVAPLRCSNHNQVQIAISVQVSDQNLEARLRQVISVEQRQRTAPAIVKNIWVRGLASALCGGSYRNIRFAIPFKITNGYRNWWQAKRRQRDCLEGTIPVAQQDAT